MNNHEKLKNVEISLINYRNEVIKYGEKIHTKKVISKLDGLIKSCE